MKVIDSVKKYFSDSIAIARARQRVLSSFIAPPEAPSFKGRFVFISDDYIHAFLYVPPSVPAVMFRPNGTIVVNNAFLKCPEYVREASLYHELGHLINKDKAPSIVGKYLYKFGIGPVMKQEYAADLYAVGEGTNVLKALEYYAQFDFVAKKALNKRIARLKSLMV